MESVPTFPGSQEERPRQGLKPPIKASCRRAVPPWRWMGWLVQAGKMSQNPPGGCKPRDSSSVMGAPRLLPFALLSAGVRHSGVIFPSSSCERGSLLSKGQVLGQESILETTGGDRFFVQILAPAFQAIFPTVQSAQPCFAVGRKV